MCAAMTGLHTRHTTFDLTAIQNSGAAPTAVRDSARLWHRPSLGSDFSIHPAGGGRGAGWEPRRARNAERRTGAATQRQDRERGAQSAGDESRAGGLGRRDRAPDPPGTPPDLLELTDRALTRLITFISYATTLDCRTRLRTTAQWVGTTCRGPTGGRVPSWGNLITN